MDPSNKVPKKNLSLEIDNTFKGALEALRLMRHQRIWSFELETTLTDRAVTHLEAMSDPEQMIQGAAELIKLMKRSGLFSSLARACRRMGRATPFSTCVTFLHIPGTGGSYIRRNLWPGDREAAVVHLGHRVLLDGRAEPGTHYPDKYSNGPAANLSTEDLAGCFVVSNVRNIFDVIHRVSSGSVYGSADYVASSEDIERCVYEHIEKSDGVVNRGAFYFPFFAQPSGTLCVDWVNRLETLNEDVTALEAIVPVRHYETSKVGKKRTDTDYRQHYSSRTVDLVETHWRNDIDLFGFDYENGYKTGSYLHQDIRKFKRSTRYVWETDTVHREA